MNKTSIGFFDIETTGLDPKQHRFLTTAVARNLEVDPWLVVNLSKSERKALLTARDWLEGLDKVVSWAGNSFDIPFMNYRLRVHNERKMALSNHFDLKAWCIRNDPYGLMKSQERFFHGMEAHAQYAGIDAKHTPFDNEVWGDAADGDVDAIVKVATHNVEDVVTLRRLYDKIIEPVDERKRQLGLF